MTINDTACPLPQPTEAPDDEALTALLAAARNVAIVGASPRPTRTSHAVAVWLMENTDFELFLVNPMASEDDDIEGHGFFSALADLPVTPDIVVVFRRSEDVPPVAIDATEAGAAALWLQLGITHPEATAGARAAGMTTVENRCIKVEYARLREGIEAAKAS